MTGGANARQSNGGQGSGDTAAPGTGPAAPGAGASPTPSTEGSPSPSPSSDTPAPSDAPSAPQTSTPESDKPAPPKPPAADRSLAGQVVQLVNDERSKAGCGAVGNESHLADAAQGHSSDMSERDYFSHNTPEGKTFDRRIREAGYSKPGAENIAKGATSASQVMDMWMNSSGHRANILNCSLTKLGVGIDTDGWLWTQDFGY